MTKLILKQSKQWEALFSPVRLDIVSHLELYGPGSIAEVAEELGRTPHSLYHHFHKLVDVGVLRVHEVRRVGTREESVYDVRGRPVVFRYEPDTPRTRAIRVKAVEHCLRQTARDYRHSLESAQGPLQQPALRRYRARLRPASVAKIQRHLDAIVDVILKERVAAAERPQDARWHTWVSVTAPQDDLTDIDTNP